jgi:hypothetical protein
LKQSVAAATHLVHFDNNDLRVEDLPAFRSKPHPASDGISSMPAGPLSTPPPFVEGRRRSVEVKKTRARPAS